MFIGVVQQPRAFIDKDSRREIAKIPKTVKPLSIVLKTTFPCFFKFSRTHSINQINFCIFDDGFLIEKVEKARNNKM